MRHQPEFPIPRTPRKAEFNGKAHICNPSTPRVRRDTKTGNCLKFMNQLARRGLHSGRNKRDSVSTRCINP